MFWLFPTAALVAQPAENSCAESVQPFLASILEELMGPVSSGFTEVRSLFEKEVDELSQNFQTSRDSAQLKEVGCAAKEFTAFSMGLRVHPSGLSFLPSPPPPPPFLSFICPPTYSSSLSSIHPITHSSLHLPDFIC